MEYNLLPNTEIKVSKICLGTMTWGRQNTEAEGHEQMDYAVDQGINFFDTAELYPVPANAETQGETERIIGSWFKKTGRRDQIVLATKIAGPRDFTQHIRKDPSFSKAHIDEAVDKSLKRMQTDYIDLYQLHWPERNTNFLVLGDTFMTPTKLGKKTLKPFWMPWRPISRQEKSDTSDCPTKILGASCVFYKPPKAQPPK